MNDLMGVQPPLIHLARVTQHPCLAAGAGHSPEEAWLPQVPAVLDNQRVFEGFLNRLHCKSILYPLTYHIFSRIKVPEGG